MKTMSRVFFIALAVMFLTTQAHAVLFWARPYNPNLQRWMTRDPIGESGGVNLYGYVANNPINVIDPLGLIGMPWDVDSVSQSIWQAIRSGDWDAAYEAIEEGAEVLGEKAEMLKRAIDQISRLDKWRKQMGKWCRKDQQAQLEKLKETLEKHLKEPYRNGKDDPETMRLRYMIDFLTKLLK
jgi:uncharacterized protein RhaS with RHS repeats